MPLPKPLFNDNGSGMHTHISLWKGDEPLFAGSGYAGLSEMALHGIGGIRRPGAIESGVAKVVTPRPAEAVPVTYGGAQVIFHPLAEHEAFGVVPPERSTNTRRPTRDSLPRPLE